MQWRVEVRQAQKDYMCSECREKIPRGEIYVRETIFPFQGRTLTLLSHRRCFNALPPLQIPSAKSDRYEDQ